MPIDALTDAWKQLAEYDMNAKSQQRTYFRLQKSILALGFLATFLAVLDTSVKLNYPKDTFQALHEGFRYSIVAVPAIAAILVGALTVFKPGVRWVLLRAGGESIKREIYQYRTSVALYKDSETRDEVLASAVNNVSDMVELGDLENFALTPYPYTDGTDGVPLIPQKAAHPDDTGLADLSGDEYERLRLEDQLRYFTRAASRLGNKRNTLQFLTVALGGSGSLIAALNWGGWVPVTTALAAAFASYLQYMQIEDTLVKYNRAKHSLRKVQRWWSTLEDEKKLDPENVDHLVRATEGILGAEMTGWARQMAEAVRKIPKVAEQDSIGGPPAKRARKRISKVRSRTVTVVAGAQNMSSQPAPVLDSTVAIVGSLLERSETAESVPVTKGSE